MSSLERQFFWGCTLTKEKPEVKWLGTSGKDIVMEVDIINQLALSQACLGPKAKDSISHVVQVNTTGADSTIITQPIIILGSGIKQVQCRLEFSAATTFKLIEGQGPVHLSGSHVQVLSSDFAGSESESEVEEEISPVKQSPEKEKAKTALSPNKQPPAKRVKLDLTNDVSDEDDEEQDSDEEEDDEPLKLVPLKDAKSSDKPGDKPSDKPKDTKIPQDEKPAKKKKEKSDMVVDEEGIMVSDDSDAEEDDEEDDDKDDDFHAGDSGDDDDDGDEESEDDDEDDEEEEEESESEDEITSSIATKRKLRKPQNEKETPDKSSSGRKKTPKKGGLDATVPLPKTPDIATVKQRLLKSPNLPKNKSKFTNFMKTNMKITEEKVVKELWTWLQKNKK